MKYSIRFFILLIVLTQMSVIFSCGCCLTKSATTQKTVENSSPGQSGTTPGKVGQTPGVDEGIKPLPPKNVTQTELTQKNQTPGQPSDSERGEKEAVAKKNPPQQTENTTLINVSAEPGQEKTSPAVHETNSTDSDSDKIKQVNGSKTEVDSPKVDSPKDDSSVSSDNTSDKSSETPKKQEDKEIKTQSPLPVSNPPSGGISNPETFSDSVSGFAKNSQSADHSQSSACCEFGKSSDSKFSNVSDHQPAANLPYVNGNVDSFSALPKLPKAASQNNEKKEKSANNKVDDEVRTGTSDSSAAGESSKKKNNAGESVTFPESNGSEQKDKSGSSETNKDNKENNNTKTGNAKKEDVNGNPKNSSEKEIDSNKEDSNKDKEDSNKENRDIDQSETSSEDLSNDQSESSEVQGVSFHGSTSKALRTSAKRTVEKESTENFYETSGYGTDSASVHFQTRVE